MTPEETIDMMRRAVAVLGADENVKAGLSFINATALASIAESLHEANVQARAKDKIAAEVAIFRQWLEHARPRRRPRPADRVRRLFASAIRNRVGDAFVRKMRVALGNTDG